MCRLRSCWHPFRDCSARFVEVEDCAVHVATAHEAACEGTPDIADADDCRCQLDSFPEPGRYRSDCGFVGRVIESRKPVVRDPNYF
jgi:hypothetical protein